MKRELIREFMCVTHTHGYSTKKLMKLLERSERRYLS